jgi:GNAT superfamily N-acetyltransferase
MQCLSIQDSLILKEYFPCSERDAFSRRIRNKLNTLSKIIYLLLREFKKRFYSDTCYYVLRRDLSQHVEVPQVDLSLSLRKLSPSDIPILLDIWKPGLSYKGIWERIRIRRMIKSGIQTPYVVVNQNGHPFHIAWFINASENDNIRIQFKNKILPLQDDEVLFEFVFTLEEFRGQGVQIWRSKQFTDKAAKQKSKWAFGYIKSSNQVSLRNAQANAFEHYMIRTDHWRFFRCRFQFKPYLEEERSIEHGKKP